MRHLILLFIGSILSTFAFGQNPNNLAVDGTIKDETGQRITEAIVTLYRDGAEIQRVNTGKNGRFDLYLDFGHEFIIEISKSTYVSKKLYVNTNSVPDDEQAWGYEFGGFVVDMLKRMEGVDYSILEKPIGKVYYEANVENFVDDKLYTRQIKAEVDRLEQAQKAKIKQEEEMLKKMEADFQLAIKDAQAAMADGDYLTAKDNLLAAKSLKPQSTVPAQMLAEVEAKLKDAGAKDDQYLSLLASADQEFGNDRFTEAIASYTKALELKPGEAYPKDRLKLSQERLAAQQAKAKEDALLADKDRDYNSAIAKADAAYASANFRDAKTLYQTALGLKADEYPKSKLKEIELRLQEQAKEQEIASAKAALDAQYADKIDKADAAFKSGNLEMARTHYEAAIALKGEERYPKDQVAAINQQLDDAKQKSQLASEQKALDDKYNALILGADRLFKTGDLNGAKAQYQLAKDLKSEEKYPSDQIALIDAELAKIAEAQSSLAQQKEVEKNYVLKTTEAAKRFNAGDFATSRALYVEAGELKPSEELPKNQIARIDAELERQRNERDQSSTYTALISEGDQLMKNKQWKEAIAVFGKAGALKPSEYYPKGQAAEAQKQIEAEALSLSAQQASAEKENNYKSLIAAGDAAYSSGNLKDALNRYDEALRIKQSDQYPKDQILKINKELEAQLLAEKQSRAQAEIDKQYNDAITRADQLFKAGSYIDARESYNVAVGYKAQESYPKEQLKLIEVKLKELEEQKLIAQGEKEKRLQYEQLLRSGGEQIAARQYEKARATFTSAQDLFPNEETPKIKLKQIEDLMVREEANRLQEQYRNMVSQADKAFVAQQYAEAKVLYEDARNVKPDEPYPTERINKINQILVDQENLAKQRDEDSRKRIVEETYDEGRTKVTIRRVTVDGKEDVYKRVIHSWGGKYYFLNEQPITELLWNRETMK